MLALRKGVLAQRAFARWCQEAIDALSEPARLIGVHALRWAARCDSVDGPMIHVMNTIDL